jgi:hypothetical protein
LALEALWINLATILAVFNIGKSLRENGLVDEPVPEFTTGFVRYVVDYIHALNITNCISSHPKPYKCILVPRAREMEDAIRSATTDA